MTKLLHLQGIRGLAICSVIAFHFFPDYCPNGYLGVDLFFVLSGYLMSMMLSRHPALDVPLIIEFLYRRIKRIVPLYYLVVIASTAFIYFCPCSEIVTNLISSKRAFWLTTNLYWGADYFEKLGASHDLFTHTWSLCLEMQFYLVFPLLWWLQMRLPQTKKMVLLHFISGVSLYFYFISDEKQAFNSMFCRIWQFLFGNMVFCLEGYGQESEKIALLDKDSRPEVESSDWIFASLSLLLLIYSMATEQHLTQNYSRMATTFVSIVLIHFGRGFFVLENCPMVFLGEISYSWYLFHWPLLSIQKMFGYTAAYAEMFLGILLSLLVAITVHYSLEKSYLGWRKPVILAMVSVLFLGCLCIHFLLVHSRFQACVEDPIIRTDYAEMSIWERKKYNAELIEHDQYQLVDKRCPIDPSTRPDNSLDMEGTCQYENPNSNNSRTIAIIGNSWAANTSPLIFDECSKYFGQIHRTSYVACEVLKSMEHCVPREKGYFELVERVKPDYLFVVQRYCYMGLKYTDQQWDEIVKDVEERLARLASHVKEKIFVIHSFPASRVQMDQLNDALDKGIPIDWHLTEQETDMPKLQEKLDQILAKCPKCEQFDYTPQFLVNGTFYPFQPEYFIAYLTHGLHFTLPALEKIRPVFTDICNKIGKQ